MSAGMAPMDDILTLSEVRRAAAHAFEECEAHPDALWPPILVAALAVSLQQMVEVVEEILSAHKAYESADGGRRVHPVCAACGRSYPCPDVYPLRRRGLIA